LKLVMDVVFDFANVVQCPVLISCLHSWCVLCTESVTAGAAVMLLASLLEHPRCMLSRIGHRMLQAACMRSLSSAGTLQGFNLQL
jgi:hypothetical protein